ncbi:MULTISPECIES: OmpA family protein [Mesorhizobium]|uniref:OmpA family protein n=1 Tax=Mesorhizobium TaxID=68287 RepID=UPI000FE8BF02|nr:OmpA family protein [Mesorhizobium sp.]RWA64286.1 MAG: OmpA family protein [Mesorhizobium sp.]
MRATISLLVLAAGLMPSSSLAGPAQSSEDIIKFFASTAHLGQSRGICVGAEAECDGKAAAPAAAGLDMLINFNLDSAELMPDAQAKLGEFAKALKDNRLKAQSFVVEGYTDASGSPAYNKGLSERRAESVTAFLLSNGIEASRVTPVGLGATHPRVANPYDPVNRRVEMRINAQ